MARLREQARQRDEAAGDRGNALQLPPRSVAPKPAAMVQPKQPEPEQKEEQAGDEEEEDEEDAMLAELDDLEGLGDELNPALFGLLANSDGEGDEDEDDADAMLAELDDIG